MGELKSLRAQCWRGQCVLVVHAIFRMRGNGSQPGLRLIEKLATALRLDIDNQGELGGWDQNGFKSLYPQNIP